MRDFIGRLRANRLLRGVVAIASGTVVAQAIGILSAPLITRLYGPYLFGLQGAFLASLNILGPLAALRYPMALVTAQNEMEVRRLTRTSLIIALITASLTFLTLVAIKDQLLAALGISGIGDWAYLLPVALLAAALYEIVQYRLTRAQMFRATGVLSVNQALVAHGARISIGLIHPSIGGLMLASTLNPLVFAVGGVHFLRGGLKRGKFKRLDRKRRAFRRTLRRYRTFALHRAPNDFIYAISASAPVVVLTSLASPAVAGLYVLAQTVLYVPSSILGKAISQPMFAQYSELFRRQKPLYAVFKKASCTMFFVIGLPLVAAMQFGPYLFAVVFGSEWRVAGVFAVWMSIWIAFDLANIPGNRLSATLSREREMLVLQCVTLILRLAAITVPLLLGHPALTAVAAFAVASAFRSLIFNVAFGWFAKSHDRQLVARVVS